MRYGCEDRDHQLPGGFQRVHGFLLKDDGDVQGFQLPNVVQRVQRVAGEAADGFGDHKVDIASFTSSDERIELRSGLRLSTTQTFIRKYSRQLPAVMGLYEIRVVCDLRLVGTFLFLGVRGDTAVGRRFRDLCILKNRAVNAIVYIPE